MNRQARIGVMVSGGGSNLQAIIDAVESKRVDAEIVFVGSDRPGIRGLERAAGHAVPTFTVDYGEIIRQAGKDPDGIATPDDFDLEKILSRQTLFDADADPAATASFFKSRAVAEAALLEKMKAWPFDLLALAGFMRTLTPYFIDRVNTNPDLPRIMNIHPALLPAFPGVDGYGDAFRYGCKVSGCTVHFVDYGEDTGPVIGQRAFEIREEDDLDAIREKGLALEWELYPECIRLFAAGRLKLVRTSHDLPGGKRFRRTIVKIAPRHQPDQAESGSPLEQFHHQGNGHEGPDGAAQVGEHHHEKNPGHLVFPKSFHR